MLGVDTSQRRSLQFHARVARVRLLDLIVWFRAASTSRAGENSGWRLRRRRYGEVIENSEVRHQAWAGALGYSDWSSLSARRHRDGKPGSYWPVSRVRPFAGVVRRGGGGAALCGSGAALPAPEHRVDLPVEWIQQWQAGH